jgi:hypothetical protein
MNTYSICFETDTTIFSTDINNYNSYYNSGASADITIPNKNAFTLKNILNCKTRIISSSIIDILQENYKISDPNIKLWCYDININTKINTNIQKDLELDNMICIILFINGVYGLHYICNSDTLDKQKDHILNNIKNNISNNIITMYSAYINTFNSNGQTKSSVFEQCSNWI